MVLPWEPLHNPYVQLFLSIPVYTVGLIFFGKSAFASLKNGLPNMDVLIVMGVSSALIYSLYGTIAFANSPMVHTYLFYETGATIITFVLLGNLIEKNSLKKTDEAIKQLVAMQVKTAKKIINENSTDKIVETNVEDLNVGDIILVHNGESIAADGIVIFGKGLVDESMLTGESIPVNKYAGDEVFAGTIIHDGSLKIQITKQSNQSILSGIIKLIKQAQASKPNIQKLGDRVSAVFVPIVIAISIITFLIGLIVLKLPVTECMLRAVAVLVISCPCAMGLATPTAIAVGLGKAAKNGILVKGGSNLERFAKINVFILDKTGTLTTGNFMVNDFKTYHGNESEWKNLIYNLELHSSHPIAKSIVSNHKNWFSKQIQFTEVNEIKGLGIIAKLPNGDKIELISNPNDEDKQMDILLFLNQQQVAGFDIQDELKPDAVETIDYFNHAGVETILLSGDIEQKVTRTAQKLHIQKAMWRQMPQDKIEFIKQLQKNKNNILAMAGDGINDAPALTLANVGISFSKATDIAKQSADIILTRKSLTALKQAHLISKQTYVTIKQNLFWAFFYNIICIPIAAAGYLHPMLGALSMALSDVIVIGNSLRLKTKKI